MDKLEDSVDFIRTIYLDVLNGYTFCEKQNIYIKHLHDNENNQIIKKKLYFLNEYKKQGIPNFDEKLKEIISNGIWSVQKEDDILSAKYQISDNEKNLKTIIPQQRPPIQMMIDTKKKDLLNLLIERKRYIGQTADDFASKKSEDYFIFLSLYKDSELKTKLFEIFDDFENLDYDEIDNYSKIIEESLSTLKEEFIQKIAVMPFFLNTLSYSKDNIFNFYNKPISQLSPYQILLFSLGNRNLNILSQSEGEPPEIGLDKPLEKVIEWYDTQMSIIKGKQGGQQMGIVKKSTDVITKRY